MDTELIKKQIVGLVQIICLKTEVQFTDSYLFTCSEKCNAVMSEIKNIEQITSGYD